MEKVKDMEKVRFQVLGYRNFKKKADGKPLTVLTAFYQCTPQDNERGSFGCKYTDFFLPDDKVGTLHRAGVHPPVRDQRFRQPRAGGFLLQGMEGIG